MSKYCTLKNASFAKLLPLLLLVSIGMFNVSCSTQRNYTYKSKTRTQKTSKKEVRKNAYANRAKITKYADKFLKVPYKYAGKSPDGFDCSGYVSYVYGNYGINLPSNSRLQSKQGKSVKFSLVNEGDLLFFGDNGKVSHVGIVYHVENDYITMIHCGSSKGVQKLVLQDSEYWMNKFLYAKDVISPLQNDIAFR